MLNIHRAERADALVGMLGDLVVDPLDDAMESEIVAVPSRGIERWLTQQLSGRLGVRQGCADGVCANVDFPFPGALVGRALATVSGVDPDNDPWRPERSVWPLIDLVDTNLDEPWLAPLASHLRNASPTGGLRRFATLRHVADLYDRYGVHRPEMLRKWAAGSHEGTSPESRWQADLWRRLREGIGTPSPAEVLDGACSLLREEPQLIGLPERFSLFGLTRLPASYLDVLWALAAGRDVHLFLLHPSPALWQTLASYPAPRGLRRADDPTAEQTANPLLGSWGRDAREMQLVLTATGNDGTDQHQSSVDQSDTVLQRIQGDVHANQSLPGVPLPGQDDERALLDPDDCSIQVHACHGRARQVEVLRDAILHLLAEDDDLEPRDVIVMCPDIETFAPLIEATFGASALVVDDAEPQTMPDLRVRLADRSLRQTNPILSVIAELLDLASSRVTASQVLDLAGRDPVRRRFRFDDDDLGRLEDWVVGAGVRWGLDAARRAPYGLDRLEANTWRAGLDRALVGVTMADERQRLVGGVLPLDDVDSGDIELVGRFAEFIDRLDAAITALGESQSLAGWASSIAEATDSLTTTSAADAWQRAQLQRLLDDLADEATIDGSVSSVVLDAGDIGSLLADRLRGRPTRANFRTGYLTICTLVPMRSVPHRVVCLLGLDDGVFPRVSERSGDDLILADPHVGDRDPRTEDRQLLLDALLAATDSLVITYTGRDERTNLERPPAVPVGELLDVIERTVRTDGGTPARDRVVVNHPLQPFDVRNFMAGELVPRQVWSFDPINLEGARALSGTRSSRSPFLPGPLSDIETTVIELDELERFLRHPARAFLRQRLGIRLGQEFRDVDDGLPVELDALERWELGDRLLAARIAGADLGACVAAERARGTLPPGALADSILDKVIPDVEVIADAAHAELDPTSLDVKVVLAGDTTLVGTVAEVRGDVVGAAVFSKLSAIHRLHAWLHLLVLTSSRPERPFEAVTVGRVREDGPPRTQVSIAQIGTLGIDSTTRHAVATGYLEVLVDLYRRGIREPVPIYSKTSAAWAQATPKNRDRVARKQWTSEWNFAREDKDAEHTAVLGGVVPFERLFDEPCRDDENGDGWDAAEDSRFGRYARRLWAGLLTHEQVTDQ